MTHEHAQHHPVVDLTDDTFEDAIVGRWMAVDLWAPWCGPCRRFMPAFEAAAGERSGLSERVGFARVNVDDNPGVAERVAPRSIPTVVLYDPSGTEVARASGFLGAEDLAGVLGHLPADLC